MPKFMRPLHPSGPVITVAFYVSEERAKRLQAAGEDLPDPLVGLARIDSGADSLVVDHGIAEKLGIPSMGKIEMHTAAPEKAKSAMPVVGLTLIIPSGRKSETPLIFPQQRAVLTELASTGVDALLGQDILEKCVFEQDGPNELFSLAWEDPEDQAG